MSKVVEDANMRLDQATEDYKKFRIANPNDFTSQGFLVLSAVLAGAQQILQQSLASQTISHSPQSSVTSISSKSHNISGQCSNGPHTDRNKGVQKRFRAKLVNRDICCIATGEIEGAIGAHIIPLNKSELVTREMLFSPRNGVLFHKDLEVDYTRHKFIFDYDGKVTVLFANWIHKNTIHHVNVSKDPKTGPSKELIEMHNQMALEEKQHYCPNCWKYVGAVNVENHTAGICLAVDQIGEDDKDPGYVDAVDDVEDFH